MRPSFLALCACLILCLTACASAPTYNWKAENALGYRVGPGDVLKVNVWKHDELSQQVTVRPDGKFSLTLVGDISSGRTHHVEEIAAEIAKRSQRYFQDNPPVSVQVAEVRSYKIYVEGEVLRGGEFTPNHQVTVLQGATPWRGLHPVTADARIGSSSCAKTRPDSAASRSTTTPS